MMGVQEYLEILRDIRDCAFATIDCMGAPAVRIIDASTAHRTAPGWDYGFPELSSDFRHRIERSKRVAVPGCYASGFNAICFPLTTSGVLPRDYPVVCHAVSGYSGAGKKAIAEYESENRPEELASPRLYALTQHHKHLPEMQKISGLDFPPAFTPYICDYFSGMTVTVPLHARLLAKKVSALDVREMFASCYAGSKFRLWNCRIRSTADLSRQIRFRERTICRYSYTETTSAS